jgi:hypothetical protein
VKNYERKQKFTFVLGGINFQFMVRNSILYCFWSRNSPHHGLRWSYNVHHHPETTVKWTFYDPVTILTSYNALQVWHKVHQKGVYALSRHPVWIHWSRSQAGSEARSGTTNFITEVNVCFLFYKTATLGSAGLEVLVPEKRVLLT